MPLSRVVAWIRRVRTASGATAVQIAEYVRGRREVVAHVGSAHPDVELGLLMARVRELLAGDGQDELDLGVDVVPVKTDLLEVVVADNALFVTGPRGAQSPEAVQARVRPTA